ncbi:hypothetical protein NHQ30_004272 [Ciborinia camelliae]|nr:hypothetical protein NHQ30_004272 [Ciborinia camelliae]
MAEVLGAVASGISVAQLAGNLASSVIKLKNYWDQIQDAPDDIAFLARELDNQQFILRSILESQLKLTSSGRPSNSFLERTLQLCQDSSDELNELVNALAQDINSNSRWKKKLGATKVVLKNDQLKKLKRRMKNATRLMNLAISWQTNATLQQQSSVLTTQIQASFDQSFATWQSTISATMVSNSPTKNFFSTVGTSNGVATFSDPENSKSEPQDSLVCHPEKQTLARYSETYSSSTWSGYFLGSGKLRTQEQKQKRKRLRKIEATYHLPVWLSNRAWQCMYTKDLSALRWNFNIETHRTLDTNGSEFFACLYKGDVFGVQRMLENRTGFVNDRFYSKPDPSGDKYYNGTTPLHVAASRGHIDLCKLLLSQRADVSIPDESWKRKTPLFEIAEWADEVLGKGDCHPLDIIRIFLQAGADMELIDDPHILVECFCSEDIFKCLYEHIYLNPGDVNLTEKIFIVSGEMSRPYLSPGAPSLITSFLGGPDFQANISLQIGDKNLITAFHQWSEHFAYKHYCRLQYGDVTNHDIEELEMLLREVICAGFDVHSLNNSHWTPLQAIIGESISYSLENNSFSGQFLDCSKQISVRWLQLLHDSGIDLHQYGEWEILHHELTRPQMSVYNDSQGWWEDFDWPLLGFKYGPCVEDWEFWFLEPTDKFAGEFWSLVESPEPILMPGTWVD